MEGDDPICKRGRPREFDAGEALDAALAVFWKHGYEGASLTDLTEAMGINRPSLYAAFGCKEELFRRAMDRYDQRATAGLAAALEGASAWAGVERVLRGAADSLTSRCHPAGCFLTVSALSCGPGSQSVRDEAAARRRSSSAPLLRARFDRAVADGELPAGTDTAALADYFATLLQGLSIQAASGADRDELHRVVDVALRAWPGAGKMLA